MRTVSILKTVDTNVNTQDTSSSGVKWIPHHDLSKVQAQFREMQVKILNMFTLAKSELSTVYKQVVQKVRKIQKYLNCDNMKLPPCVLMYIQQITYQADTKTDQMLQNIDNTVINTDIFDQLLSYIPDSFVSQHLLSSYKRINKNNISSSRKLAQKTSNIVFQFDFIGQSDYQDAIRIKPEEKRIRDLGLLSGRWNCLEGIDLDNKQISRVVPLKTVVAQNLQEINLSMNQISTLGFLDGANYPVLRVLNLSKNGDKIEKNLIANLSGLQKTSFPNLKILNLSDNRLSRIQILKQSNFPQLIDLNLSHNKIENCKLLSECQFPRLQILNLGTNVVNADYNELKDVDFVVKCYFYRLKIFSFCFNRVAKLDCLGACKLEKLEGLLGYNNKIEGIGFLEFCNFPMLKEIVLNNNMIKDISVIQRMSFKHLCEFDLENNCIQLQEIGCFVTKNNQCRRAKKKYPFIQL